MLAPTDCIVADFESDWFERWAAKLRLPSLRHSKWWETAAIAEALAERGALTPGARGLGLGCGVEPLPSLWASLGVDSVATDQDPSTEASQVWDNSQLAHGLDSLYHPEVVDRPTYDRHVTYRPYDMTVFEPGFVDGFDFVWHNCSIGHVGSLERSMSALVQQAQYLHDGGHIVFTTEINIASLNETIASDSDTCIWRLADLIELFERMDAVGMTAERLELRLGDHPEDLRLSFNIGPVLYLREAEESSAGQAGELKLPFGPFALTQILLIFKKTGSANPQRLAEHREDARRNEQLIRDFAERSDDLRPYFHPPRREEILAAKVEAAKPRVIATTVAGGRFDIVVPFTNRSMLALYDTLGFAPLGMPHFAVGTRQPDNGPSAFRAASWPTDNRIHAEIDFGIDPSTMPTTWNGHRADPGQSFEVRFAAMAPTVAGVYTEHFGLIHDGFGWIAGSDFAVEVVVLPADGSAGNDAQVERLIRDLARAEELREAAERRADAIEQSTSWRVTAPLRRLSRLLRR